MSILSWQAFCRVLLSFPTRRSSDLPVFHPTTLVHFRKRLVAHQQAAVAFEAILKGLEGCGLLARRRKERLDSRSEEHTSELQSLRHLVCRLLLEKKNEMWQIDVGLG